MVATFKILMVEDDARYQHLYKDTLQAHLPVDVSFVTDGEAALTLVKGDRPPDLVVLDLQLPGISGDEVLRRIRQHHGLSHLPVMILTGSGTSEKQMELLEGGADDFVEKGSAPEIFVARVQAQMRHKLAIDRLEKLAVDRDMFAAGVLQDIRTVESTIVGLCRRARQAIEQQKQGSRGSREVLEESMDRLTQEAARLGRYATHVIQSVRGTGQGPRMGPQNLATLFHWIENVLTEDEGERNGPEAPPEAPPKAPFSLKLPDPLYAVHGDENYLRLALLNIIQNAIKFSRPSVPLVLEVTQETDPPDERGRTWILTRIRDNGRGMHEGDLSRVFRTYERGERGEKGSGNEDSGMGLGLSIVAKVISGMGGQVWAELPKDGGEGTVIGISLPAAMEAGI